MNNFKIDISIISFVGLMLLFTFGIYGIYWQYAAGKRLAKQGAEDRSLIYLIFNFTPIAIINPFLMQQQANELK